MRRSEIQPDSFELVGYTVRWEGFQPSPHWKGKLHGEWVASAKSGSHSIAYPAYVGEGADWAEREGAKLDVLHKLVCLLEGTV